MNSKKEYQSEEQREPMFEMPECEFFLFDLRQLYVL